MTEQRTTEARSAQSEPLKRPVPSPGITLYPPRRTAAMKIVFLPPNLVAGEAGRTVHGGGSLM